MRPALKPLLLLLLSTAALAAVPANTAFEKADLPACLSGAEWTAREVRASLVVFPGGGWSLAIDHHDLPAGQVRPMRECLYGVVRGAMEDAAPTRQTRLLTRVVKGPLPPADRVPQMRAQFEAQRGLIAACVLGLLPPVETHQRLRLRLTLSKNGAAVVESLEADAGVAVGAAAECTRRHLGAFDPGTASCEVVLEIDGVGTLRPDGSAGDELGQVTALASCPEKREAIEGGTSCSAKGPEVCSFPNGSWCACEWSKCVTPAGPIPGCKPASGWVCRDDGCPREPRGVCSTEGKACHYDDGMCVSPAQCRGGKWQAGPPLCRPAAPPAPSP